jgi:hypothetical protein
MLIVGAGFLVGAGMLSAQMGENSNMETLRRRVIALAVSVGSALPTIPASAAFWRSANGKLAAVPGLLLSTLLLISCATTQPTPGNLSDARQVQSCAAGTYYCHGQVVGCCPNGWGCASTHCINPQSKVAVTCRPGHYYCHGEVEGCCPNGWGCGSKFCIRPARQ